MRRNGLDARIEEFLVLPMAVLPLIIVSLGLSYGLGSYTMPLKIARPFPNARCLGCHGESQRFLKSEGHPPEDQPALFNGQLFCIDCHGPAHPAAPQQASR